MPSSAHHMDMLAKYRPCAIQSENRIGDALNDALAADPARLLSGIFLSGPTPIGFLLDDQEAAAGLMVELAAARQQPSAFFRRELDMLRPEPRLEDFDLRGHEGQLRREAESEQGEIKCILRE